MFATDTTIREPAVAGSFYPGEGPSLARMLDGFFAGASSAPLPAKAIVAPHAGYVFSGPIAATAYAGVAHKKDTVRRVVLLGPAHRYGFTGLAVSGDTGLRTPLGVVDVDRAGVETAAALPGVHRLDRAFDGEHSLEVHLPFIQRTFPEASVVPLVVGDAAPEEVDGVLEALWGGPETLVVVSSDLSHYLDQNVAREKDLLTAQTLETLRGDKLDGRMACGAHALAGLLKRAQALDLRITTRDLRTSADTAGSPERVVGYGAFSVEPADEAALSPVERRLLIDAALEALANVVRGFPIGAPRLEDYPWPLRAIRRTFVTLEIDGHLRGCIGTVSGPRPLIEDVMVNTIKSATQDPRFPPMTVEEAARATLTVSILSHDRPMTFTGNADLIAQLRPGHDGLILRDHARGALFLPKVWDQLPDPQAFVAHLKQKAGLPPDHFSSTLTAQRFSAETFS